MSKCAERVSISERDPGRGTGREVDVSQWNVKGQDAPSFDTAPEARTHSLMCHCHSTAPPPVELMP